MEIKSRITRELSKPMFVFKKSQRKELMWLFTPRCENYIERAVLPIKKAKRERKPLASATCSKLVG